MQSGAPTGQRDRGTEGNRTGGQGMNELGEGDLLREGEKELPGRGWTPREEYGCSALPTSL